MSSEFVTGDRVQIIAIPPYVKTAEPMPMMRPATVITLGEIGTLLKRQPGNDWSVRLENGAYLLNVQYFAKLDARLDPTLGSS
jgi:hypothetical protein